MFLKSTQNPYKIRVREFIFLKVEVLIFLKIDETEQT